MGRGPTAGPRLGSEESQGEELISWPGSPVLRATISQKHNPEITPFSAPSPTRGAS